MNTQPNKRVLAAQAAPPLSTSDPVAFTTKDNLVKQLVNNIRPMKWQMLKVKKGRTEPDFKHCAAINLVIKQLLKPNVL